MTKTQTETAAVGWHAAGVVTVRSTLSRLVARPAVTIAPDATLAAAAAAMEAAAVSALLVADVGAIITERDITRAFGRGAVATDPVDRSATPHPIVVPGAMTVLEATGLMLNEHVRHLVVRTSGGLAIVSLRDVAAVLLQSAEPEIWLASLRVAIDVPSETWLG